MPAVRCESRSSIIAESECGVAFDRDVIVVVKTNQPAEPGVTGEGRRFVGHPFHHVAIAGDEIRVMVENLLLAIEDRGHVRLADRHANRVSDSLPERAGSGFDAGCVTVLRMTWRLALPLPELFKVVEGQLVTSEIQHAVEEHR